MIPVNQRIYKRCLEVAKAMKPRVQNGKSYHVCYLIRKGKVICIGTNDYTKTHNVKRFGKYENKDIPGKERQYVVENVKHCFLYSTNRLDLQERSKDFIKEWPTYPIFVAIKK